MREEYDIKNLNPRKNPYAKKVKKQITINIDNETINYFKRQSEESGIPYQTLINLYLSDCAKQKSNEIWLGNDKQVIIVKDRVCALSFFHCNDVPFHLMPCSSLSVQEWKNSRYLVDFWKCAG